MTAVHPDGSVRHMTTTKEHVYIDGRFGATFEDGKITGWHFTPALDAQARDWDGTNLGYLSNGNYDESPFWKALRDTLEEDPIMQVEWTEDGPPAISKPLIFPPEQMYTDEGNLALRWALDNLDAQIRDGYVRRPALPAEIRALKERVKAAGHAEVYDTEPEWHIVDTVNEMCDREGWTHISRDEI